MVRMTCRLQRAALAAVVLVGCGMPVGCGSEKAPLEMNEENLAKLGELPGLTDSSFPGLKEEFSFIKRQAATPVALTVSPLPEQNNFATALVDVFDASLLSGIIEKIDKLFPEGPFQFGPLAFQRSLAFRQRYEDKLQVIRNALSRPQCEFAINFRNGFSNDLSFIDMCRVYVGLESFHVAELLREETPDEAVGRLRDIFKVVHHLGATKHVETRLAAAQLRERALRVLAEVVRHEKLGREALLATSQIIDGQLKQWPYDGNAWIGDRAQVMHSYELLRLGYVDWVLTAEEMQSFIEERNLPFVPQAVSRELDADQLYYLRAMRKLITSCRKPFFERAAVYEAIRKDLHAKRNTPDFPLAAGRLFLPDVEAGQKQQAEDRARTEAWASALALARGSQNPPFRTSPVTGEPYRVTRETTRVSVWSGNSQDRPAIVPITAAAEQEVADNSSAPR